MSGEEGRSDKKGKLDKKARLQTYLLPDDKEKLNRLARACNTSESELANRILSYALNHYDYVNWLQSVHGVKETDQFRIIPVKQNGKLCY